VTGVLHMGHMLNNTIQDILVRRARMEGKNACWVPGTDHASIATEAKVVNKLAAQGIKKTDLTRDEFLKHAWEWTDEHGGIILKQLRKLGASCDWDRTAFTMDEKRSESVLKVFVDLYNKGLIYRGVRMVNWDPKALTALSDEEVIYKEEHSKLYYLKYMVEGDPEGRYAVVATTRPETIMGDTAMCINPNDPKNTWLKGKKVIVPLVGRVIPVIEDDYVDIEFGTGCLKVTPAHDVNDYMLGEKYNLPSIDIFNDNGTLSEAAGLYIGMDRFDVREQIEKDLATAGLLEKVEAYTNKVGCSERTNVPIEPKLSMQWFLKMQHFADMALPPVMNDELKFYPAKYKNTYKNWLENIKDWCISRQLWWGHRIPAYFLPEGGYVVAATPEEALALAKEKTGNAGLKQEDLRQDEDCLDTWFSSWLWPISLFDGINNPGNEEISYYYPTSDLVTGPDIIFFWVARMIMAGYEYEGKMPFKNVYFTGIVRDKLGRKMSKSLGNSPDPLDLIEKYGADGVRMGMMLSAPAGNDILFDDALCEQGRNFNNKIWNAFRLIKGWEVSSEVPVPEAAELAMRWFESKQNAVAAEVADLFNKYRLSEALMAVYKLFWDEFSSWYLEMIKPAYGQPINRKVYEATIGFFDNLLHLLHPFMPFITEELWQHLCDRTDGESLMVSPLSMSALVDEDIIREFEVVKEVISNIRSIRLQKNIAQKEALELQVIGENPVVAFNAVVTKMCNLSSINVVENKADGAASFMVGTTEYAVPLGNMIDVEAEIARMEAELKHKEGFLQGVLKKLGNEKFVNNAPAAVLEMERKKQADAESIIKSLKESIAALKKKEC
ncbi:valine--tRNA ligase, partial [uncultured Bacteroides sp.]|uniref:valine--tRNA ligase n=1 Tax=uncultured Bacteroides sp. TaxID=162156 RepID=UPI002599DF97